MKQKSLPLKVLAIALPLALQNLINVGVGVADTLMLGDIGEIPLSAASQANQLFFIFTCVVFGLASGSTVLTAQYWGKGDTQSIRTIIGVILRLGIAAGVGCGVLAILKPQWVMAFFTSEPSVIEAGCQYLRIVGWSYLFSSITGTYLISLRSVQNVKISMYIYGTSFLFNVFMNWVLIFGHWGAPRLELRGAAIATLMSRVLECGLTLFYMYRRESRIGFTLRDLFRPAHSFYGILLRFGLPVVLSEVTWGAGMLVQAAIIGRLGLSVMAASSFLGTMQQLGSIAIIGVGGAASILVGNLIGAGQKKEALKLAKQLVLLAVGLGVVICLVTLCLRGPAPHLINCTAETAAYIRKLMYVTAYILFFQSITITTMAGALRGGGDTRLCAVMDVTTLLVLKIGFGVVTAFVLKLPPVWVYFILSSDEFLKALVALPRLWSGKWIHDTAI